MSIWKTRCRKSNKSILNVKHDVQNKEIWEGLRGLSFVC